MWNTFMALGAVFEMLMAGNSAHSGNVAETILYCFYAYVCFRFMNKSKDGDG